MTTRPDDDEARYAPPDGDGYDLPTPRPRSITVERLDDDARLVPPAQDSAGTRLTWGLGGALGCLALLLLPLLLLIVLVGAGVGGVGNWLGGFATDLGGRLAAPTAVAQVDASQTIVRRIEPLGQLVSTSVEVAKARIAVNVNQSRLNVCRHRAEHVAEGTFSAGIDLTQLDESSVSYDAASNTYTLRLPRAQLTSCSIDFIDQYNRTLAGATCLVPNYDWDQVRQLAQYQAMVEFRDDVLEGGVLRNAENEARALLRSFIGGITEANVIVEFVGETQPPLPATCNPRQPDGWVAQGNGWVRP